VTPNEEVLASLAAAYPRLHWRLGQSPDRFIGTKHVNEPAWRGVRVDRYPDRWCAVSYGGRVSHTMVRGGGSSPVAAVTDLLDRMYKLGAWTEGVVGTHDDSNQTPIASKEDGIP